MLSASNFGCTSQLFAIVRPDIFLEPCPFLRRTAVISGCAFAWLEVFNFSEDSLCTYESGCYLNVDVSLSFLKLIRVDVFGVRCRWSECLLRHYNPSNVMCPSFVPVLSFFYIYLCVIIQVLTVQHVRIYFYVSLIDFKAIVSFHLQSLQQCKNCQCMIVFFPFLQLIITSLIWR